MNWQLAAFAMLGLGLLAGFAWYERTRPDARIVALVGTLAAFAALGRIAFAAVPNVKPTSDIVLISGYALGGAPGYVVGAVAALTSNFFFGQGPWTPWQMAGWGITGLAGALLGRVTRGNIGRLPLALVSFVLGFAFTALQDLGDWVTYSDHSFVQLGVYVGKGVGFDLVHAAGCFGFAMLFGPALIRTLTRFRTRIQVTWLAPAARALPLVLAAVAAGAAIAGARPPAAAAATDRRTPVQYLFSAQNRDGGFGQAPGQPSDAMVSGWAALAVADAGQPSASAVNYVLRTQRPSDRDPGDVERTVLAGGRLAGSGLERRLRALVRRGGDVGGQTNLTAFAILAMRAAAMRVPPDMYGWLAHQHDRDGGFNYGTRGGSSDVDDTGAAIAALAGAHRPRVIASAVAFIRGQQNRDGGFGDQQGAGSNAQSTAFAVCGLIAAGVNPAVLHRRGAPSPLAYLRSL
ncbi:MAG TPA: prenyltransferase/squalene oxidase repeat-containing protein, partial [Solirubrobacteraceae bacterium]|nr:prenyltransferase/squalene oxidase repeat-containing protein [Solirubrobacteraceae bacterium]